MADLDLQAQREDLKCLSTKRKRQAASDGYNTVKISVKSRKKFIYVYTFVSFGLEHSKALKATYSIVHAGFSGDLSGLGKRLIFYFTKCLYCLIRYNCYFVTEKKSNKINLLT